MPATGSAPGQRLSVRQTSHELLRRRRCRLHTTAHFYLNHPDDAFLLSRVADELGLPDSPPPAVRAAPDQSKVAR